MSEGRGDEEDPVYRVIMLLRELTENNEVISNKNQGTKWHDWIYKKANLKRISSGFSLADKMLDDPRIKIEKVLPLLAANIVIPDKTKEHDASPVSGFLIEKLCDIISDVEKPILNYLEQVGKKPPQRQITITDADIIPIDVNIVTIEFKYFFGFDLKTIHLMTEFPEWFLPSVNQAFSYMMANGNSHAIITDGVVFLPTRLMVDEFQNKQVQYNPSEIPPHEFDVHCINGSGFYRAIVNWILKARKCGQSSDMSKMQEFYDKRRPQGIKRRRSQ